MIVRGPRKQQCFTVLDNAVLRETKLSFRARGLLAFLLSQPVGFAVDSEKLAESSGGHEGRDAVRTALREIEDAGYLRREKRQLPNGHWFTDSVIYEVPGGTDDGFPGVGSTGAWKSDVGSADVGSSGAKRRRTEVEELEEGLTTTPLPPASGGEDDLVEDPIGDDSKRSKDSKPRTAGSTRTKPRKPSKVSLSFDRFWNTYPRRVAKDAALKAFEKAVTRAPVETILDGAVRYRDDPNRVMEFTRHPATWLNGGCWDDDPLPPRGTNGSQPGNMKVSKFEGPSRRITQEELEAQGL